MCDQLLDVPLQTTIEILEHGGAAGQDDILVQRSTNVDRTILNAVVHDVGQWCDEVWIGDLRIEEDLRTQKALEADVHLERLLRDVVDAVILLDELLLILVVALELLGQIRADV